MIFYFSEKTCPPCVEYIVNAINENFTSDEQKEKVIFISPDYPHRLRNNCFNKHLLTLQSKYLGIPLEKDNIPFLFILDKDMIVRYLYIYNKAIPSLTDVYLKELKMKFF